MSSVVPVPRYAWRRRSASLRSPRSSTARRNARVGAEGKQFGRPGQGVDDLGRERARERGHFLVPAAAPGEERGHGQGDQQREAEGDGSPREDEPDGDGAENGRPRGNRHGQERAQVEVLQGVDVVDSARQQIATAPSRQRGRHPGGQAVVQP